MSFSYHFGNINHPQGQIYVLAYKLEIGVRILPCVGFYFDWII